MILYLRKFLSCVGLSNAFVFIVTANPYYLAFTKVLYVGNSFFSSVHLAFSMSWMFQTLQAFFHHYEHLTVYYWFEEYFFFWFPYFLNIHRHSNASFLLLSSSSYKTTSLFSQLTSSSVIIQHSLLYRQIVNKFYEHTSLFLKSFPLSLYFVSFWKAFYNRCNFFLSKKLIVIIFVFFF